MFGIATIRVTRNRLGWPTGLKIEYADDVAKREAARKRRQMKEARRRTKRRYYLKNRDRILEAARRKRMSDREGGLLPVNSRGKPSYLDLKSGWYRFRRKLPRDVRLSDGRRRWSKALNTRDPGEAGRRAREYIERTDEIIRLVRQRNAAHTGSRGTTSGGNQVPHRGNGLADGARP